MMIDLRCLFRVFSLSDNTPKEALDAYPAMKLYLEAIKALPQVGAYEQSKS